MNLKIVLPVIAGLGLTLFSFKPMPSSSVNHLENGNFRMNNVQMSDADISELSALAVGGFIFHHNVHKDKDATSVTDDVATTKSTVLSVSASTYNRVTDILAKYE